MKRMVCHQKNIRANVFLMINFIFIYFHKNRQRGIFLVDWNYKYDDTHFVNTESSSVFENPAIQTFSKIARAQNVKIDDLINKL